MGRRRTMAARERDNNALVMKRDGVPYDEIARNLGWDDVAAVKRAIQRALADMVVDNVDEIRIIESARLDDVMRVALGVMTTKHYHVSASGRVAEHPITGEPLVDHGPTLQAINALVKISESRRKLLGADSAIRHIVTMDAVDAEIRALEIAIAQQQSDQSDMVRAAIGGSPPDDNSDDPDDPEPIDGVIVGNPKDSDEDDPDDYEDFDEFEEDDPHDFEDDGPSPGA